MKSEYTRLIVPLLAMQMAVITAVAQEQPVPELRLHVDLADGSHLIGIPSIESLPVRTPLVQTHIAFNRIRSIKLESDRTSGTIQLKNGDVVTGVPALEALQLRTLFGHVSVDIKHIGFVTVDVGGPGATVVTEGLVLYYPFDSEGQQVEDLSGNKHHGVNRGAAHTPDGKCRSAFAFDGKASHTEVAPGLITDLPAWENYTISVWFLNDGKGDHGQGYGQKIIDQTEMYHDFYLCLKPQGSLLFFTYEGSGAGLGDGSRNFLDGEWHHAVVVKKGVHGELWVDGELKDSRDHLKRVTSKSPLLVGNSVSSDSFQRKPWSGKIDELMIFNRPLSQAEIRRIHSRQK